MKPRKTYIGVQDCRQNLKLRLKYILKKEIMAIVGIELPQETDQSRLVNAAVSLKYSGAMKLGEILEQLRYSVLKEILLLGGEVLQGSTLQVQPTGEPDRWSRDT
jgi:hypothetical protein